MHLVLQLMFLLAYSSNTIYCPSLFSVPPLTDNAATSKLRPSTSADRYRSSQSGNGEPYDANAFDPGSPTDDDEPPPSPIASSKSAQRRIQASPRHQMEALARKRPLDSSDSDYGNPPKLTKTSKGKQPAHDNNAPDSALPVFKKPWLPESFTSMPNNGSSSRSAQPEVVDSFASTVNKSFNTTFSSQQTVVDTPRTSFGSDAYDGDVQYPNLTRTSSLTLGSCEDQDLLDFEDPSEAQIQQEQRARMEELEHNQSSQDPPPHSSSAYGSVDEEVMWERSFTVETEESDVSVPARQCLTRLPNDSAPGQGSVPSVKKPPRPSAEPSPFNRPSHGTSDHTERRGDSDAAVEVPRKHIPFKHGNVVNGENLQQPGRTTLGNSPARALSKLPSKSINESPSKLPHYIRNLPAENLFNAPLTEDLKGFPYFVLFICSRLASEHSIPLSMVLQGIEVSNALTDPSKFLEQVCANLSLPCDAMRDQQKYWSAWERGFEGYTFKARIDYNDLNLSK